MVEAQTEEEVKKFARFTYPKMTKTQGGFSLSVEPGDFTDSEIIVMLGENGTGKTTFIRMLAGMLAPDEGATDLPQFNVSYKPQKISPKFEGSVRSLLHKKASAAAPLRTCMLLFAGEVSVRPCTGVTKPKAAHAECCTDQAGKLLPDTSLVATVGWTGPIL